ncbi:MAG: 2-deoxy-5-keto-D-gluconate 6-phosphate aldolase domain-containing protein [Acidimicrobiia bacterium]
MPLEQDRPLGYDRPLYILACDHRGSFQKKMFGISGTPTPKEAARISDAKKVVFEGLWRALEDGTSKESAGILIDEEFGAEIARKARAEGLNLAMPVEKSGQDEFDFDYGEEFGPHITDFDPAFTKVLVRYNPVGDPKMNERQAKRLQLLSGWLRDQGRRFLFELLVPAEPSQLEKLGNDTDRYDTELRPKLMVEAIAALQGAGVEPDIWKIEGLDRREDCESISAQVRSGGRDGVGCVVLGRGADDAKVHHWLRQGAGVAGYLGFAIGRTIWWDAVKGYLDGSLHRETAAEQVARRYRESIAVYEAAAS